VIRHGLPLKAIIANLGTFGQRMGATSEISDDEWAERRLREASMRTARNISPRSGRALRATASIRRNARFRGATLAKSGQCRDPKVETFVASKQSELMAKTA